MTRPGPARPRATFPAELTARFPDAVPLGAGAMGGVFAATDQSLGRRVAVKVLHAPDDDEVAIRFLREAETLAKIRDPHVLGVLDHGRTAEGPYMVMELLEGAPLDRPPPDLDLIQVARDVAAGLEAVHAAKVIHRDVKPANLMWVHPGRAVLIDFGLVHDPGKTALTRTGSLVGTPAYMSPEILMGESLSPSSDWYALGITLYEIAEGQRPYGMEDIHRVFAAEGLPPLEFSRLAPEAPLRRLILALTANEPEARPPSLEAVDEVLDMDLCAADDLHAPTHPIGSSALLRPGADTGPHAREAASSGAARSASLRPVPDRRLHVAAAALLSAGLLAILVTGGHRGEALDPVHEPAPTSATPEPESPFPLEFPRLLAEELEDAMMLARSPDGEVVPAEGNLGRPGYREFLEPDPVRWGEQLTQAPRLGQFDAWVGAGGDPRALPPTVIEALRGVGGRYRNQGLPDPFFPLLEDPSRGRGPTPRDVMDEMFKQEAIEGHPVPAELGPWFQTALAAHQACLLEQERLSNAAALSFETRRPVDDFPEGFLRIPLEIRNFDLRSLAEALYGLPSSRQAMARWTRKAHRLFRRFAHAAARTLAEEPETAVIALPVLRTVIRDLDGTSYGPTFAADPARELGLSGSDPYQLAWRGYMRFRAGVVRFHLNLARDDVLQAAAEDFEAVLATPGATPRLQTMALQLTLDSYRDMGRGELGQVAAERWLEVIDALRPGLREKVYDKVLEIHQDTGHPPHAALTERIEAAVLRADPASRLVRRMRELREG